MYKIFRSYQYLKENFHIFINHIAIPFTFQLPGKDTRTD